MSNFLGIDKIVPFVGDCIPESKLVNDEIERLIFAPDPASGNPCGSLAYFAKGNDEVAEYVRSHYLNNDGVGTSGFTGGAAADVALELVPDFGETREHYLEKVASFIKESYED